MEDLVPILVLPVILRRLNDVRGLEGQAGFEPKGTWHSTALNMHLQRVSVLGCTIAQSVFCLVPRCLFLSFKYIGFGDNFFWVVLALWRLAAGGTLMTSLGRIISCVHLHGAMRSRSLDSFYRSPLYQNTPVHARFLSPWRPW